MSIPSYIRIHFTRDSAVEFADPETGKKEWYGSDYGKGTHMDVLDILSGGPEKIRVRCLDGEIGILQTSDVRVEGRKAP